MNTDRDASDPIATTYDPKPMPIRSHDWSALRPGSYDYDYSTRRGGPIGYGRTEAEAIEDLRELEAEREDA